MLRQHNALFGARDWTYRLHRLWLCRLLHHSCVHHQEPRINQVGIQYLSNNLHRKVFPKSDPDYLKNEANSSLLALSKDHLKNVNLLGKKTQITEPIDIPNFPSLVGNGTLDEHFHRIGGRISKPYLDLAESFFHKEVELPPMPKSWKFELGWIRYAPDEEPRKVDYPLEDALVFDVEVLYKISNYPVMATAASSQAWYGWVSPVLTNHTQDLKDDFEHLIPLDTHSRPKLLAGYNVSYDRARVKEEYNIKQSKAFFLDAMALHISTSGFCSQQRPLWHAHRKHKSAVKDAQESESLEIDSDDSDMNESNINYSPQDIAQELMDDPWLNKGTTNSLASAAEFHCGITMDKDARDMFSSTDIRVIVDNFQELMAYCAKDVGVSYQVTKKLLPEFRAKNPHPVSFAALKLLGTLFCPTTTKWESYIQTAEKIYQENREKVGSILRGRANALIEYIEKKDDSIKPDIENDPWLMHLNWSIKEVRTRKDGTPSARQAFLTGYPEWYRELFKTVKDENGESQKELNLSVRTRVTPYLLRLKWEGYPLVWTDTAGWCFKVPANDTEIERLIEKKYLKIDLNPEEFADVFSLLREGKRAYELFRIPHPEGPKRRCTLIMSKSYVKYFDSGELSSEYEYASEILNLNATASYWMGNRARIMDQFVVYSDPSGDRNHFFNTKAESKSNKEFGMIIPKFCTMGTVTRRATENTWLTASNSKSNRIGSELKAMVVPPKDYVFVGADVDSEELWIASLIGDSMFRLHGSTALGWMTLEGDKNEKTDLHSRTADIMGILRNDAKIFNYGRIYGAGVKFATQLLQKCSNNLSDGEAAKKAQELYAQTKGLQSFSKVLEKRMYHGGTESVMFNALEAIAHLENPRTPVLGASITDALTRKYLNKNNYLTSRVNWAIQSSGVDYLHLLIISMEYLIEKFGLDARLMITVHDELRYMVRKDQSLQCALLLQISNLWTRAMFCEQLGIQDVPQSCAFFSEVDIDHVLRKEVGMSCVTPSHPESIPPGESYSIKKLLESIDAAEFLGRKQKALKHLSSQKYVTRVPVMQEFDANIGDNLKVAKLRLQNATDKSEWSKLMTLYMNELKNRRMPIVNMTGSDGIDTKDLKRRNTLRSRTKDDVSLSNVFEEDLSKTRVTSKHGSTASQRGNDSSGKQTSKHARHLTKDDDTIMSEQGDQLLLEQLAQANAILRGQIFHASSGSTPRAHKSSIKLSQFSRNYRAGLSISSSRPNTFMGPLTDDYKRKQSLLFLAKKTQSTQTTNNSRRSYSQARFAAFKRQSRALSLTTCSMAQTRKHIPISGPQFTANGDLQTENPSIDRNFRRRRDGAVYESEYRFGRGYRRSTAA